MCDPIQIAQMSIVSSTTYIKILKVKEIFLIYFETFWPITVRASAFCLISNVRSLKIEQYLRCYQMFTSETQWLKMPINPTLILLEFRPLAQNRCTQLQCLYYSFYLIFFLFHFRILCMETNPFKIHQRFITRKRKII